MLSVHECLIVVVVFQVLKQQIKMWMLLINSRVFIFSTTHVFCAWMPCCSCCFLRFQSNTLKCACSLLTKCKKKTLKNCMNAHTSLILLWNFFPCTFTCKITQTSVKTPLIWKTAPHLYKIMPLIWRITLFIWNKTSTSMEAPLIRKKTTHTLYPQNNTFHL